MNSFHRPHAGLQENDAPEQAARSPFADIAGRFANWMTGADRLDLEPPVEPARDAPKSQEPASEEPWLAARRMTPAEPTPPERPEPPEESSRFPLAPFGYNRTAVDEHLATLERELEQLRAKHAPMASITEELERIGEQTASILVVAHDQAHETTRLAQEQAERCVADAAANAVAMTEEAKKRLRDIDNETDAIWRERERLLEDVRVVSAALGNLADQASERFPAAEPVAPAAAAFPAVGAPAQRVSQGVFYETPGAELDERAEQHAPAPDPQATQPFDVLDDLGEEEGPRPQPGDTGSWLAGLEPPDLQK
ncbi:MAG TPA: DivIVA domain-containing protein [Solirubrobacteraceae bacterium]|nr:DivIVA domain-containing protein [Solirubrobacteraceae bacterium]